MNRLTFGFSFLVFIFGSQSATLSAVLPSDPYGQQTLRNEWERLTGADAAVYQNFRHEHLLVDLAEDQWLHLNEDPQVLRSPTQDLPLSVYLLRKQFLNAPYRVDRWSTRLFEVSSLAIERPMEALQFLSIYARQLAVPFILAALLIFALHLWMWAPAVMHDMPPVLRFRTRLPMLVALAALYLWSFRLGIWLWTLHGMACLVLIYSRQLRSALTAAILTAALFAASWAADQVTLVAGQTTALEALHEGRTRLEYSTESLEALSPLEKTLWSDLNGEPLATQFWLQQLPPGRDRQILELNLAAHGGDNAEKILKSYEELDHQFPNDPIIQFNQIQLLIQTQSLVKADQIRKQVGELQYGQLSSQANRFRKLSLLPPTPADVWQRFGDSFKVRWQDQRAQWTVSSLRTLGGLMTVLQVLLPIIMIFLALTWRRRASGICTQTGTPTLRPDAAYSPLYLASAQARESTGAFANRQHLDALVRSHQRRQQQRVLFCKFFIRGSESLIYDQRWLPSIVVTGLFYSVAWWAFNFSTRAQWSSWAQVPVPNLWAPTSISGTLIVLALAVVVVSFIKSRRGAHG